MRCAIAQPCAASSAKVLRISRSSVPCTRSLGLDIYAPLPKVIYKREHGTGAGARQGAAWDVPSGGGFAALALEAFGLEVGDEGLDEGLKAAVHDVAELVHGDAGAVVGDAVLGKVVGADLLAAVAGADLLLALGGDGLVLLFLLQL